MKQNLIIIKVFLILTVINLKSFSAEPSASQVFQESGVSRGLAVIIGCESGTFCVDAAKTGTFYVYGITLDNNSLYNVRKKVLENGVQGLVSVDKFLRFNPLPFASDQVNLLVIDLDLPLLSDVSQAEIDRVTAPYGASYVKKGGVWNLKKKPFPSYMDDWSHYDKNAQNTQISNDKTIKIANSFKWYNLSNDFSEFPRISSGKIVLKTYRANNLGGTGGTLHCLDAFNGIRLWQLPSVTGYARNSNVPLILVNNKVYYPLDGEGKPVSVIDANTGVVLYKLDKGGNFTANCDFPLGGGTGDYSTEMNMMMAISGGKIIQTVNGNIYCLNESDGSLNWTKSLGTKVSIFPTIDTINNRVFVCGGNWVGSGRDFHSNVTTVQCFDLINGNHLWTQNNYGASNLSQVIWNENKLILYNHRTNTSDPVGTGFIGRLNPSNGVVMWSKTLPFGTNSVSRFFVHKDKGYQVYMHALRVYNLETGAELPLSSYATFPPGNLEHMPLPDFAACSAPVIINDWFYNGGGYIDPSKWYCYLSMPGRTFCGYHNIPAHGSLFTLGNGCKCWKMWRGYSAFNSDTLGPSLQKQLDTGSIASFTQIYPEATFMATNTIYKDARTKFVHPFYERKADTLVSGENRYISVNNEHRIDAYAGQNLAWSFHASGRIFSKPILVGDNLYFGATDGYIYCLSKSTGNQKWRYHVAPRQRIATAFSQVESAYPVFGVTHFNGLIYGSAGRMSEIDRGIYVCGLNPSTGTPEKKFNFYLERKWLSIEANWPKVMTAMKLNKNNDPYLMYRNPLINGPVIAIDTLPSFLGIRFFDNAIGTQGKPDGDGGWQVFLFKPDLDGELNIFTMAQIITVTRMGTGRKVQDRQQLSPLGFINEKGHCYMNIRIPGTYTVSLVNASGKTIIKRKIVSNGKTRVDMGMTAPGYYVKYVK